MRNIDFDFVWKNFNKHINIAAKANKRKTKIIKLLSNIDIKPSIY
jgi:hypothetical protein